MSSTGIKTDVYDNLEADIIDVNDSLFIKKINILDFINDLSENLVDLSENVYDLSENVYNKIFDLSENVYDEIFDISGNLNNQITNIINNIFDLSGNINNNINDLSENTYDISQNLSGLNNTVTDLSQNVQGIKATNTLQDLKIFAHGAEISANTDALVTLGGIVTTNAAVTTANTSLITGVLLSLGIPSTPVTPGTGIYGSIDSKTSRSLFGSGNVAIYGVGPLEYINLVYNNDHFEDIKLISNHALNLKEPYKSLPDSLNNLSNIVNTKQDNLLFTSPLFKDASNNITIDLSGYILNSVFDASLNDLQTKKQDNLFFTSPLSKDVSNNITINLSDYSIGNIKGTKITLNEGYLTSDNLICYHNNQGTYFTDNGFNSYFNLSSATVTNTGLAITPFITNYNRMFKNGINNAIKISSSGYANSGVNSSTYILLDSGSNPTPGTNMGEIKFNIATQIEGALDRFVIKPTTSIFYNNVGIGKTPSFNLDISGYLNVSSSLYTSSILPRYTGSPEDMNIRTRTTGNLNLVSETGNIYLNTSTINRFRIDPSGNINAYSNFDVSGNITGKELIENSVSLINKYATIENLNLKQDIITCVSPLLKDASNNVSIDLSAYALKNSLNASNVTAGTLPVSFGGTGRTNLTANQILIGNGTDSILQSQNLIWDISNNGLGIGTTQFFDTSTNFQINNRRLWINSTPNNSISVLSTDKYGTGTTESYIKLQENRDIDFRVPLERYHNFTCGDKTPMFITKDSITVENVFVLNGQLVKSLSVSEKAIIYDLQVNNDITATKLFSSNGTSKNLIKFQTKLGTNGLYYYNLDISKYYKTGQNINGKDYKIFNLTSWSEDAFTIINKCTVYISSEGSGIKYIMFYDNWGAYLSNGNQSGWQRDNSIGYMTFMTSTSKNIITILENLL